jgi:hypothetical protein
MQAAPIAKPPIGVCFDAAFGSDIESLVALALLFALDNRNECRVVCLSTTLENLDSAGLMQSFNRAYGGRPAPVGMVYEQKPVPSSEILKAAVAGLDTGVKSHKDTAEPHNLIRNALTAQHDGNAIIVSHGPNRNLHDLVHLYAAKPWINSKVLFLMQSHAEVPKDWPAPTNAPGAADCEGWSIELKPESFVWPNTPWADQHPIAKALAIHGNKPVQPAAPLAVLASIRAKDFSLPLSAEEKAEAKKVIEELVVAKPIPRAPRRRPF